MRNLRIALTMEIPQGLGKSDSLPVTPDSPANYLRNNIVAHGTPRMNYLESFCQSSVLKA